MFIALALERAGEFFENLLFNGGACFSVGGNVFPRRRRVDFELLLRLKFVQTAEFYMLIKGRICWKVAFLLDLRHIDIGEIAV